MGGSRCTQLSTYVAGRTRQILQGLAPVKPVCPRPLVMAECLAGIAIAIPISTGCTYHQLGAQLRTWPSKGYPVIRQMVHCMT